MFELIMLGALLGAGLSQLLPEPSMAKKPKEATRRIGASHGRVPQPRLKTREKKLRRDAIAIEPRLNQNDRPFSSSLPRLDLKKLRRVPTAVA